MTDSPAKLTDLPDQTPDPVPQMLEGAWDSVSEMLMEDEARWKASADSPVAKSSTAASAANGRQIHRETVGLLVHAAMEFSVRAAFAQKLGVIHPSQLQAIMQSTSGFATALVNDVKLSCTALDCDWKGKTADAGPTAKCAKCGSRAVPMQGLVLAGANGAPR